jgi:hypothetical protein
MRGYTHTELSAFTHEELSAFTHYELMNAIGLCDETLTKDHSWNLKLSDYWFGQYGINTLTLGISQVEGENNSINLSELVAIDGVNEIKIVDNPFINSEALRLSVIDDMFNVVKMYKYYPYTIEYRGFPYLELGDVIDIIKMNDDTLCSPIYEVNLRYDGGLYGKLNASALSKSETLYRNTQTLSQRVKYAEVQVDKIDGTVTILAGDYYDGKLVGTYYNFDGDAFTITNADDEVVFSADSLGNLTLKGNITGSTITGSTFIAGNDGDRFEFDDISLRSYKNNIARFELEYDKMIFRNESSDINAFMFSGQSYGSELFYITTDETIGYDNKNMAWIYMTGKDVQDGDASKIKIETKNANNTFSSMVQSASRSFISGYQDDSVNTNLSASGGGKFAEVSVVVATSFSQTYISAGDATNGSSLTLTNGRIELYSNTQTYYIYIGGAFRTITRDANGFLKC